MIKDTNPFWYFRDNDDNENFINLNLVNFIKITQCFDNTYDIEFHLPDNKVCCTNVGPSDYAYLVRELGA